jgi:hypothetical protein
MNAREHFRVRIHTRVDRYYAMPGDRLHYLGEAHVFQPIPIFQQPIDEWL